MDERAVEVIPPEAWRPTPWANGGGVTHPLRRWSRGGAPIARLSIADIDRDGPFSTFAGDERWLAMLAGDGPLALGLPSGVRTLGPGDALAFAGALPVVARPHGRARVFNLIAARGVAWSAHVATVPMDVTITLSDAAVVALAPLSITLDGRAIELPAQAAALVRIGAPTTLHVEASPAAPAIVLALDGRGDPGEVVLDGRALRSRDAFHDALARGFGFDARYGRNLDAAIDLLTSLDEPGPDGRSAVPPGRIVRVHVDHAGAADPDLLAALVDVLATVNVRRRERGHMPAVALSFDRDAV